MADELSGSLEPLSVIHAIEANLVEWYRLLARLLPGAEIHEEPDMLRTLVPIQHPLFTAVLSARFAHGKSHSRIEDAMRPIRTRRLPAMWWIGPSTHPIDLPTRLAAYGWMHTETLVGMALDLNNPPNLKRTEPPGDRAPFDLTEATSAEELAAWSLPYAEGFGMQAETLRALAPMAQAVGADGTGQIRLLLGHTEKGAVSSAMLFMGAGVAGMYGVATVAHARNQGFATATVLGAVDAARAAGYRVCILHATPMAVSVYRRLGFVEYCRLRTLTWRPPAE